MAFFSQKKKKNDSDEILNLEDDSLLTTEEMDEDDPDMLILDDPNASAAKKKGKKAKKARQKASPSQIFARIAAMIAICVGLYCTAVFSQIPFIRYWRTIYIETAMSTMTHQWLATAFIPGWIVDEVMEDVHAQIQKQEDMASSWNTVWEDTETETEDVIVSVPVHDEASFYEKFWELDTPEFHTFLAENPEYLEEGYGNILIDNLKGKKDIMTEQGDQLLALDTYNNLMVLKVTGKNYQGRLAIVKDPRQVDLPQAEQFGTHGETAQSYATRLDTLIVVNASRFSDPNGHGTGATIKGSFVQDGQELGRVVGNKENGWKFCGFKSDYRFFIGNIDSVDKSEFIWGMECVPALVINGESVVDGSFGMGIQPRTAVGQAENGDFMMLVVDGRQVGWSIGCTVAEMAKILLRYDCYQAMNMDGGSSSVMYYGTTQITKASSVGGRGRYTPNAFVVRKRDDVAQ